MKEKSIKINAILNVLLTLSNIVFPLITFPYISRVLNPTGVGVTSFFTSISSYCTLVASLGISTYGIRAIAKVRNDKNKLTKVFQELLLVNLFMAIIVSVLLLLLAMGIEQLRSEMGLLVITCVTVLASPFSLNWFYSGIEEYDYIVYASITLFSILSSNILNILQSRKFISFKLRNDLKFKHHLKPMWYLFASLLAVNVYTNLDTVMLGFISGNSAVGLYSVATKVKWILLSLVTSISTVLLPRFSFYISQKDISKFREVLRESISVIFFISIPLTVFFLIEARDSILLLGGNKYLDATLTMQVLMPILLISGFSNITGNQILIPTGREKYFMLAVSSGAFVNLILNFLLMPKYGILGGGLATLFAEITQMVIQVKYSIDFLQKSISVSSIFKFIFSAIISALILLLTRSLFIYKDALIQLTVSGLLFFLIYVSLLLLLRDKTIKNVFGNLK